MKNNNSPLLSKAGFQLTTNTLLVLHGFCHPFAITKPKSNQFKTAMRSSVMLFIVMAFLLTNHLTLAQCVPTGNPDVYGVNQWNAYVYSNYTYNDDNPFVSSTSVYRGYKTYAEQFDENLGNGSISGTNICGSYSNQFSMRLRMRKTFPAGSYIFTIGGDEGYRLSMDGGNTFILSVPNVSSYTTTQFSLYLDGTTSTDFVIDYYEKTGSARLSFDYRTCNSDNLTSLNSIGGADAMCGGGTATLVVNNSNSDNFQWGTGNYIGLNPIAGQTSSTITVTPTTTTTYWVRRLNGNGCSQFSTAAITTLVVYPQPVAGTISGSTTVCANANATTLNLNGSNGNIQWQSSIDNVNFNDISGANSRSFTANNLTATTYYRAVLSSGICPTVTTATATITVNPIALAGSITGANAVCAGTNQTTLTLNNAAGSIQWQSTTNAGGESDTYTNILGANGNSLVINNLNQSTYYRAVVKSGVCPTVISSAVLVSVSTPPTVGNLSGSAQVCGTTNANTLTIANVSGDFVWQSSTDNVNFTNISGANDLTYTANNLSTTTYYRVMVRRGACNPVYSNVATITVSPRPVAGSITGATTVCAGTNSTTLSLSGSTGTPQWQSSLNNVSFGNINGATATSYTATNLTATTYYRAVLSSGTCNYVVTSAVAVTTNPGVISGARTVCAGTNSTTLTVNTATGGIQWQSSPDNITFNNITGANSTTYTATNLNANTYYRVRMTSGSCNGATTASVPMLVNSASVAGTISGGTSVCTGANSTRLSVTGQNGTIQWQSSISNSNFVDIAGATTNSYTATNLNTTTFYRVVVTNGVCSSATSSSAVITVSSTAGLSGITGDNNVCAGTNSSTMNVLGATGSIQWQSSTNNSTFNNISGATGSSYTATNLNTTTYYRAVVSSGSCGNTTSASVMVWVNPQPSTASVTTSASQLCQGNSATLTAAVISSGTGAWSVVSGPSTDVAQLSNTTAASTVFNPSTTGNYTLRYTVSSGVCTPSVADVNISVSELPSAAAFSNNSTVQCALYAQALDAVAPTVGSGTWTIVSGPSTAMSQISNPSSASAVFTPASTGTYVLRWTVSSGGCSNSATKTINTVSTTPGGVISLGGATCSSSGTMSLNGFVGQVLRWESATSPYTNWNAIANTNTTYSSGLLTENTRFRAIVQLTGCPASQSNDILVSINNTTWNGNQWSNGIPSFDKVAVMAANYNEQADINACAMVVTNQAVVTIPTGYSVHLDRELRVDTGSNLTFESTANLIQNSDVTNQGVITYKRNTTPLFRLDYVLWSTPVTTNQTLLSFSPQTLTNRFYTYNSLTNLYTTVAPETTTFQTGKGYLIRMPNNWVPYSASATPAAFQGVFQGAPNNGPITINNLVDGGTGNTRYNAIGNPYPSPIGINAFLNANQGNIEGTIWFWRKTNDKSNPVSYSTCTSAGCTLNNGHHYNDDQVVSAGQGFFVKVKNGHNSVQFNNSMRQDALVDQFFKSGQRNRFWLDLSDSNDKTYAQNMIAYLPGATMGYDEGIDGLYINDNPTALSANVGGEDVVINARPNFFDTDEVNMQFRTTTAGNYTIKLSRTEGIFAQGQSIYLRDNYTGAFTDLTQGPYTFACEAGNFTGRFDVMYQSPLSNPVSRFDQNAVVAYSQQQNLHVYAGTSVLASVKVYDLRGRLVLQQSNINSTETHLDAKAIANQVLLLHITDTNGNTVVKKVVNE